ncbi:hypothetical protein GQ54DRAFT_304072 [Martensiomyces pterosporus]|nr:hypothetical protein GQ54DRAFT_304072 [Martensiomyces pterosporus]
MAFLDELPLDILLAVVKWLMQEHMYKPEFSKLLPVASVSISLRQCLLPLLYRDLLFEFQAITNYKNRHNASLARSAGCSEYAQRVTLFVDEDTDPNDIVRAVRDDMDVGSETKWPNLRSYTYKYDECLGDEGRISCSDVLRQLDKELPKLRQVSPVTCDVPSGIVPLTFNPPSVSFSTQLTSFSLNCFSHCIDANHFPHIFAPTLVDLTLCGVNPENVWNMFYDGQESQTVVFARLKRLDIMFENPLHWGQNGDLPPHLQGATQGMLTRRSVWAAGADGGKPGCRVPLFPVLHTLRCDNMAYDFHDFISRTQCYNSLVSLYVDNRWVYFDFDVNMFKNLETVGFNIRFPDTDEVRTGSVDLYKSAFTNLLRTKTNVQRIAFKPSARDALFQVPLDIGCANLRSLLLGVEVDFKSMRQLLSNLKHLIELELDVDYNFIHDVNDQHEDGAGCIDEVQPPQAEYPPVSSTLRRFTCWLRNPKERHFYTASYAFELALHLPALESMTLGVHKEGDVALYEALVGRFLQEQSRAPYMNDGLLNAKVIPNSSLPCWLEKVELIQETHDLDDEATAAVAATRLSSNIAAEYARHRRTEDKHKSQNMVSVREFMTDSYGYIPLAKDTAQTSLELKYLGDIAQHTCGFERNFSLMGAPHHDVFVTNAYVHALPAHICPQLARKGSYRKLSDTIRDATIEEHFDWTQPTVSGSEMEIDIVCVILDTPVSVEECVSRYAGSFTHLRSVPVLGTAEAIGLLIRHQSC